MNLKRRAIWGLSLLLLVQLGIVAAVWAVVGAISASSPEAMTRGGEARLATNSSALAAMLARSTVMSQAVCDLIYLDFTADPDPAIDNAPLTVVFTDTTDVPAELGEVEVVAWYPTGSANAYYTQVVATEPNFEYTYEEPGIYDVCFRVRVNGQWCPPFRDDEGDTVAPFCKDGFVVVNEGNESEEPPTATMDITELTKDKEALVPLCDWVPLYNIVIGYQLDDEKGPAYRYLKDLTFQIRADSRGLSDLGYQNIDGPTTADLLEFALIQEGNNPDSNNLLDEDSDGVGGGGGVISWDAEGNDRLGRVQVIVTGGALPTGELRSPQYKLNFLDALNQPYYLAAPVQSGPEIEDGLAGNSYILAVRTSALWQSGLTLSCDILGATLVDKTTGQVPTDEEGEPIDSLPEFPLVSESGYSSSFSVMDTTGFPGGKWQPIFYDTWNRPRYAYTVPAEWTRPSWNIPDQLVDSMGANILDLRQLVPLETWTEVIGINVHSTKSVHLDASEAATQFPPTYVPARVDGLDKAAAQLEEVNIIVTDIGADPAAPGSGGLDPRDGFDQVSDDIIEFCDVCTTGVDFLYSGVWVWHDSNNNGQFDPPTSTEDGVTFNGDFPLIPMSLMTPYDSGNGTWEYVPYPPGGGDPWWKLKLRFLEGYRRATDLISDADNTDGYIELVPDGSDDSQHTPDYFVTVRADSGNTDTSTVAGDGVGLPMGADFRVMIEPRRYNALSSQQDGGIYVSSQLTGSGERVDSDSIALPWQNDERWYVDEPWWNQRTMTINTVKPLRTGVEVSDLVMSYESRSPYAFVPADYEASSDYDGTPFTYGHGHGLAYANAYSYFGYVLPGFLEDFPLSNFDVWMDPYAMELGKFQRYYYTNDASRWYAHVTVTRSGFTASFSDGVSVGHFPYEIAPFYQDYLEEASGGPRSNVYPVPPAQPTLPSRLTWPVQTEPNRYPRISDWAQADRAGRTLGQKMDILSDHTALLGINLVGTTDPNVNKNRVALNQITVAFWGPDFDPTDLTPLDSEGTDLDSGLILWQDADSNGVFFGSPLRDIAPTLLLLDFPVPLRGLAWPAAPELVDLDGDYVPDDMDGDGVVDSRDRAWVVKLVPEDLWELPDSDLNDFALELADAGGTAKAATEAAEATEDTGEAAKEYRLEDTDTVAKADDDTTVSVYDPAGAHGGDDLFVSVRLSDKARRFQQFRAVVPATLPERAGSSRRAGIQFYPEVKTTPDAFVKNNPEEDPVQDYCGHDAMNVNIPTKIETYGSTYDAIVPGGAARAVLGVDITTNRPETTEAQGANGTGAPKAFTVAGAGWAANAFAGDFLIDSAYEPYEILSNTDKQLVLLSGQPRDGAWRIVRNPSFLEQVFVELYPDTTLFDLVSGFNAEDDLLPLDIDQEISGVAIYRDNDQDPGNRNGYWDPDVDIPVTLDAEPDFIGQVGEVTQVRFIFSTPGTDDYPVARTSQPRHRQVIPDTFGTKSSDPDKGADFFIVVRPSPDMDEGDAFRAGIVCWGPNTPTAPDPDVWTNAWNGPNAEPLSSEIRNEFVKFLDFPWAEHGLGFVTVFRDAPKYYAMDGAKARVESDISGFNYVRSSTTKKVRSNPLIAAAQVVGPRTLIIEDTTPGNAQGYTELPNQILDGQEVGFTILGQAFGSAPQVALSGYNVNIASVSDTKIGVTVSVREETVPTEPIILIVRNTVTGQEVSRNDLFVLVDGSASDRPVVTGVTPDKAGSESFPVTVTGRNFDAANGVVVKFGGTTMPVQSVSATRIEVSFPSGGIASLGLLDVSVTNSRTGYTSVAQDAFEYENAATRPTKLFLCGPGSDAETGWTAFGDALLSAVVLAGLILAARRRNVSAAGR